MTNYRPHNSLGTRDLLASIDHDRRARKFRAHAWVVVVAFITLFGAYAMTLGLALSLEFIRHLFRH